MKVIVREGSAAKNFEALIDLLPEHYENMMFCSDDKHPDDLIVGHVLQTLVNTKVPKNGFQEYMKSIGKLGGQNKLPRLSNDRKIADFFNN